MAWLWSDDLARLLISKGMTDASRVAEWIHTPVAFAVPDDVDPEEVAAALLGVAGESVA